MEELLCKEDIITYFENILIIGGNGMIGKNINFGIKPTSEELNITNLNSINNYVSKLKNISCIINLASINLRESENNIKKSIDVNINGTLNILNICKKLNIPYIHLSTGAVFSSTNNNIKFDENFKTCPNCIYGYTKESSEKIALLYEKTILIRTGWLFGGNQKNHYKYVESCINNLTLNLDIKSSNDFIGSPTYVMDLIEKIKYLIINSKYGINHVVNSDSATGYDIAIEISNILNKDKNLIISMNSYKIPNSGPDRSKSEFLESIHEYNHIRSWKIALKEYIDLYLKKNNIILDITNKKESWKNRKNCRLCNSYDLKIFFKLESTPLANHFVEHIVDQELFSLDICICNNCKHIQLLQIVDPEIQYSNYFYVSSTSNTMKTHLEKSVIEFVNYLKLLKFDNILEIGANDGTCIKYLLENNFKNIIGVDPAKNINKRHNLPIISDFFCSKIVDKLKYSSFKLIYAFHCCAHIEDIEDIFNTIYILLEEDGSFIMEVGYFYQVFKNKIFDIIYHEHIDYHTVTSMNSFSSKKNLKLYKVKENNIQGGSIQFFFCKKNNFKIKIDDSVYEAIQKEKDIKLFDIDNLINWKNYIIRNGKDINYLLNSFVSYGKTIIGYGAPAKLTTFMYQYKLSNDIIKYIIEDNLFKQYLFTPGLHIPIRSIEILDIEKVDYIVIFSWNFSEEIIKKLEKYRKNGLRIIIPFPEIKII